MSKTTEATALGWMQKVLIENAIERIKGVVQVRIAKIVNQIIDEEMAKAAISVAQLTNVAVGTDEIIISIRRPKPSEEGKGK